MTTPSEVPITRQALSRVGDRLSFLYAERCVINRDGNALTITDHRGIAHLPATQLAVLLLGPGTKITYAAMSLLGDAGVSTVWVGERGCAITRMGAHPPRARAWRSFTRRCLVTNARGWTAHDECMPFAFPMRMSLV